MTFLTVVVFGFRRVATASPLAETFLANPVTDAALLVAAAIFAAADRLAALALLVAAAFFAAADRLAALALLVTAAFLAAAERLAAFALRVAAAFLAVLERVAELARLADARLGEPVALTLAIEELPPRVARNGGYLRLAFLTVTILGLRRLAELFFALFLAELFFALFLAELFFALFLAELFFLAAGNQPSPREGNQLNRAEWSLQNLVYEHQPDLERDQHRTGP